MSCVTSPKNVHRFALSLILAALFLWPSIICAQPVADAGDDQEVVSGQTVTLDGSGSTPIEAIDQYQWVREEAQTVELLNADTAVASFEAPAVEAETQLEFTLTVYAEILDGFDSDTVSVWVYPGQNGSELEADAGPDQYANQGDIVELDGTGSTGAASYAWIQTGATNGIELEGANTDQPSFLAPSTGGEAEMLSFQLTVSDGQGGTDTDSVDIYVFPANVDIDTTPTGNPLGIRVDNASFLDRFIITSTGAYTQTLTADGTEPVELPHGLTDISIQSQTPITGTTVYSTTVTFYLPTAASPDHGWAKLNLQGNGAWIDFTDQVVFNPARTVVSMTLTDNGPADDNPATGVIDDPSGLALFAGDDDDDDDDDDDGGGGGGSCFILICMPR